MRKALSWIITVLICLTAPTFGESYDEQYEELTGYTATDSMQMGTGISMMGWGIAIVIGISILALALHQSTSSSHSSS